jgi:hypothetical protein
VDSNLITFLAAHLIISDRSAYGQIKIAALESRTENASTGFGSKKALSKKI